MLHRSYFAHKNSLTSQYNHSLALRVYTGSLVLQLNNKGLRARARSEPLDRFVDHFEITPIFGCGLSAQ